MHALYIDIVGTYRQTYLTSENL